MEFFQFSCVESPVRWVLTMGASPFGLISPFPRPALAPIANLINTALYCFQIAGALLFFKLRQEPHRGCVYPPLSSKNF
jgi:hypothetical protein